MVLQGYYTGRDKINAHITGSYFTGGNDWSTTISLCGFKDEYNGKKVLVTVDKKEITLDNWTEKEFSLITGNDVYDLELKNVGTQKCVTITPVGTWDKFEKIPRGKYQIQVQIDNMINTMFIYIEY